MKISLKVIMNNKKFQHKNKKYFYLKKKSFNKDLNNKIQRN